jgi:predicted DCC family thiol-disulfide oxidoreductase YuxK
MQETENQSGTRIVFFDGVCGLCNSSVDWLLRHDKNQRFLYSPLQGQAASEKLTAEQLADLDTIVYFRNGKSLFRSDAALYIVKDLGGIWSLLFGFIIVPRFLRDGIYKWVSRNRYKWFGKKEACRIPSKAERARFLD